MWSMGFGSIDKSIWEYVRMQITRTYFSTESIEALDWISLSPYRLHTSIVNQISDVICSYKLEGWSSQHATTKWWIGKRWNLVKWNYVTNWWFFLVAWNRPLTSVEMTCWNSSGCSWIFHLDRWFIFQRLKHSFVFL